MTRRVTVRWKSRDWHVLVRFAQRSLFERVVRGRVNDQIRMWRQA